MNRELIVTADGSHTLRVTDWHETYHSIYGAVQESRHVYISAGLKPLLEKEPDKIRIFEMGFGTGLNAFLTLLECGNTSSSIWYETIEAYPLQVKEYSALNYANVVGQNHQKQVFGWLHHSPWEKPVEIQPGFRLLKKQTTLAAYENAAIFDLVYFDAFAPGVQPELWTIDVFKKMHGLMNAGAVLMSYCSKSMVRKAMLEAGFNVAKLPGPPGKREIIKAVKTV